MKTAVAFLVYIRPETTKRVWAMIKAAKPPRLYLIADGPKTPDQAKTCKEVRSIIESGIDWDCELHKIYSDKNLGCAHRATTGLDYVFEKEEQAIILEDDTLPDPTFFEFCEELLDKYKDSKNIFHICGTNSYPEIFKDDISYHLTSIANMWGWATWSRSWKHYDLSMNNWKNEDSTKFLRKWCLTDSLRKSMHKMFDIHCNNADPWTWDYQWFYACWKNNGLSALPSKNLVSNIGIGPDATHTKSKTKISMFPKQIQKMYFPLVHPNSDMRNISIEKKYRQREEIPKVRRLKNYLKSLIHSFDQFIKN